MRDKQNYRSTMNADLANLEEAKAETKKQEKNFK